MKALFSITKNDRFALKGKMHRQDLMIDNFFDNTTNVSVHCVSKQSSITKSCRQQKAIDEEKLSMA